MRHVIADRALFRQQVQFCVLVQVLAVHKCLAYDGQQGAGGLLHVQPQVVCQSVSGPFHGRQLGSKRCFESSAVHERAARKRGVNELPQSPLRI